jgi:3',5'-cyclic AMP phosphodiesterase CpdA
MWLSKRGLGAANLMLRRQWQFPPERARRLVRQVEALAWEHLVITGDLTQLGMAEEFALARRELAPLLARGTARVTVIPGNHDRYVPEAAVPGAVETHFGEFFQPGPERFTGKHLGGRWWLAAWDSAVPMPAFRASGIVAEATLAATERWLAGLPAGARVVVANHYPVLFPPHYRVRPRHELVNLAAVRAWVVRNPIDLYLHGHDHRNWTVRLDRPGRPLLAVNSASSTQVPGRHQGSAFHVIQLADEGLPVVTPMQVE